MSDLDLNFLYQKIILGSFKNNVNKERLVIGQLSRSSYSRLISCFFEMLIWYLEFIGITKITCRILRNEEKVTH